jgi:ABC-type transport system involved in multi-copper enzyme maturation permease subunit
MMRRVSSIAYNTFREVIRDRILYNLVAFALLLIGSSLLFGKISVGVEKIILINLGLTALSLFGVVIAIFIGIGLVSKDIERRTLYTVLARPVRRWEFVLGKFAGLSGTLVINAAAMLAGIFVTLLLLTRQLSHADLAVVAAAWLILLELLIVTALALLFSTFSTPVLSAIFAFLLFVVGNFGEDLWTYARDLHGFARAAMMIAGSLVPNLAQLNVISEAAHGQIPSARVLGLGTAYSIVYVGAVLGVAMAIFERRTLK